MAPRKSPKKEATAPEMETAEKAKPASRRTAKTAQAEPAAEASAAKAPKAVSRAKAAKTAKASTEAPKATPEAKAEPKAGAKAKAKTKAKTEPKDGAKAKSEPKAKPAAEAAAAPEVPAPAPAPASGAELDAHVRAALQAIREGKAVELIFRDGDTNPPRTFEARQLIFDTFSQAWYLWGWDRRYNAERHHRMDLLEQVNLVEGPGRAAQGPFKEGTPANHIGGWLGGEPIPVKLVLQKQWIFAVKQAPAPFPEFRMEEQEDGRASVSFTATDLRAIARWCMQFGDGIQVLEPQRLVDRIKQVGICWGGKPQTAPQPAPKAEARSERPEPRSERPEPRSEGRSEGRSESRSEGRSESRSEGRSESRSEGRSESRSEGRSESRSEGRSESRREGRSESRREGRPEPRRESRPEPRREAPQPEEKSVKSGKTELRIERL